eukprot:gene340-221_t
MAQFSVGVRLDTVDDILGDPQDCVLPLLLGDHNTAPPTVSTAPEVKPDLVKQKVEEPKLAEGAAAKIRAADCLSCKGCVTTEALNLLEKHSWEELLKNIEDKPLTVISISAQSLVRLCQACKFDGEPEIFLALFRGLIVEKFGSKVRVVGTSTEDAIAVLEAKLYKEKHGESALISSECPGWTIYAQRVAKPWVVEKLYPRRSAQQIQGHILKTDFMDWYNKNRLKRSYFLANRFDRWSPESIWQQPVTDVYHAYVAPCHDKKVEAALPHYELSDTRREVDIVIATAEIILWLEEHYPNLPSKKQKRVAAPYMMFDCSCTMPAMSSDSYGYWSYLLGTSKDKNGKDKTIVRNSESSGSNCPPPDSRLEGQKRDGLFRTIAKPFFYLAYGINNAHNILNRLEGKKDSKEYGFIDILACAGGCLNGGGQVLPDEALSKAEQKERYSDLMKRFSKLKVSPPENNSYAVETSKKRFSEGNNTVYRSLKMSNATTSLLQW